LVAAHYKAANALLPFWFSPFGLEGEGGVRRRPEYAEGGGCGFLFLFPFQQEGVRGWYPIVLLRHLREYQESKIPRGSQGGQPPYPPFTQSATLSPIIIDVQFVFARTISGIIDASATLIPSSPCTRPYWSTTAFASVSAPILHVPDA